jgi:hypothetical protein
MRMVAAIAAALLAAGLGVGLWATFEPGSYGNSTTGCVRVALPSSTGGVVYEHCGPEARRFCATEFTAHDQLADRARPLCLAAGYKP